MAQPLVMGDKVQGNCSIHQIPNPASGRAPARPGPCPSRPRSSMGLEQTVTIGGKAVAVMGSSGYNTPPHVGLHPSDPNMVPTTQEGKVLSGSPTVTAGGKAIATTRLAGRPCARRCRASRSPPSPT